MWTELKPLSVSAVLHSCGCGTSPGAAPGQVKSREAGDQDEMLKANFCCFLLAGSGLCSAVMVPFKKQKMKYLSQKVSVRTIFKVLKTACGVWCYLRIS